MGHVVALERPPGSKHLSVATVDLGNGPAVAVTGAPNIGLGQKVPVVRIGGTVPVVPEGQPFVLQPRAMMGITGEAMILSERELGISDEHSGILVLPDAARSGRAAVRCHGWCGIGRGSQGAHRARPEEVRPGGNRKRGWVRLTRQGRKEAMKGLGPIRRAIVIVTFCGSDCPRPRRSKLSAGSVRSRR